MERFEHRHSRPLHRYRHGPKHYRQHRDGEKHGHHKRTRAKANNEQLSPRETVRTARRWARSPKPFELAKQIFIGIALSVAVAFVILSVWAVVTVLQARSDLRSAQTEATALAKDRNQLFTSAGRAEAGVQIGAMQHGASSAASLVDGSIPLKALSWIPFVGQQVTGVTQLVNDFDTTSVQASGLLISLNQLVAFSHGTSISLPALRVLNAHVHVAVIALRPLDRGSGILVGPLASARNTFDQEIAQVTGLLTTGGHLLDYAGPFLGDAGPRRYLVAGENNAEMRDQGAVLSWAILSANNGTFSMTHAQSVGALAIRHPAPFKLPAGTATAFGDLDPTQIWQSVNATADFPLSAQVMAAMYRQRTHLNVDGVIGVDPIALQHVLEAVGPVPVSGIPEKVKSGNVLYVLMHGLYLEFPHDYQQGTRHDEIAAVASAAVHKMKTKHYDLAYLVDQLSKSVGGRHLLVWSRFPVLEHAVTNFGASGSLVADGTSTIHLSVQSAVAAKLDWYIHTAATYTVSVDPYGTATIQATVVIANTAPVGCLPGYVCGGPKHPNAQIRGQYVGRLDLWFPSHSITETGLPESGLVLARAEINVLPGRKETLVLDADINNAVRNGHFSLHFIPQSTLTPQLTKVIFSAPGWSVSSGPSVVFWVAKRPVTYSWQLSH